MVWLKKFDSDINDEEGVDYVEKGETEKLSPEPKTRDASTSTHERPHISHDRLSWMIAYNQIGSLTSLHRSKVS